MFLAEDVGTRPPAHDDFWYQPVGFPVAAGVRVSSESALAVSALFSCVQVIGQTYGALPVHLYRRKTRGRERATDHWAYKLLHARPNRWQTPYQYKQMMGWHASLRGNAYSRMLFENSKGHVRELVPMHPDHVEVKYIDREAMTYRYSWRPGGGTREIPLHAEEVLHIRDLSSNGIEGFSPLSCQLESVGEALAAQQFSARHLANNASAGTWIEFAGSFKDDNEKRKFRTSWQESQSGVNRGKTAVLEKGMKLHELGLKMSELQLIEMRKMKGYEIAGIYRMPPHKIGLMENATFSNIEHQAIEFVTDTMQPRCVNVEQQLGLQLLLDDELDEYYFEFLLDALMRGDMATRGDFYAKAINPQMGGWMLRNEARERENMDPVDGFDEPLEPMNARPGRRSSDRSETPDDAPETDEEREERKARGEQLERSAAERVLRKEAAFVAGVERRHAQDAATFLNAVSAFYAEHADFVAQVMVMDEPAADSYCQEQLTRIAEAHGWCVTDERAGELVSLARAHPRRT